MTTCEECANYKPKPNVSKRRVVAYEDVVDERGTLIKRFTLFERVVE